MAVEKRNIFLKNTAESMPFASISKRGKANYPERKTETHAEFVKRKLQECYAASITQKQAAAIRYKEGIYLEFSGAKGHDLAIKSLENYKTGIRLLNVHEDEEQSTTKATVYIPAGKESFFLNKIESYAKEKTEGGNPKNDKLVRSIDDIRVAILNSFWIGKAEDMPGDNPVWCELWLRYDYKKAMLKYGKKPRTILFQFVQKTKSVLMRSASFSQNELLK